MNLSTSSRQRLQGVDFLAASPGSSSSISSPSAAGAGGRMAGSAARTRPRRYWPTSGGKRRALRPPAAHRLSRAGRSPGYLTAPAGPRPPPALAPLLVGRIRPVPMWPNPGSPREATNRKTPGQRPAGREGDGARGDLSPPLARTSLSGHLYSGQGGFTPQRRRLGFGGHVRFGQGFAFVLGFRHPASGRGQSSRLRSEGRRRGRAR